MATTTAASMRRNQVTAGLTAHVVLKQHLTNVAPVTRNAIEGAIVEFDGLLAAFLDLAAQHKQLQDRLKREIAVDTNGRDESQPQASSDPGAAYAVVEEIAVLDVLVDVDRALTVMADAVQGVQKHIKTLLVRARAGNVVFKV